MGHDELESNTVQLVARLRERIAAQGDGAAFGAARASLADTARRLVEAEASLLDPRTRERVVELIVQASAGLGPLERLMADPAVEEVMVNGLDGVGVERAGVLSESDVRFQSVEEIENVIERVLAPVGRRVDEATPVCDARLPDGSRVNVVIPPLALDGPVLTIRRFRHRQLDAEALVANGTLSRRVLEHLASCVRERRSLLVCGGTGSGKTTTLNVLSSFIPAGERIVTIEDAAELRLRQGHVVRLESRPPGLDGRGEVTIRMLVRNALRMRPDRIVVGEVRGGEAIDMLAAMTTGHDGSLTTVHASSPAGALRRIETMALMADVDVPHRAVRAQIAEAFDLIVHQARVVGGARQIVSLAAVEPGDDGYRLREVMTRGAGGERWMAEPRATRGVR
jgi:pilus assembly protein CpaF